jgi:putative ABC transport system permease protein
MSTRKRPDEDFDREIRAHLDLEAERLMEDGMAADDARDAATRTFGNVTAARERFYEAGHLVWLDRLRQDVRCASRNLRRAPIATAVAVASLAAGIGATTVSLTVRDVVFHKPPPLYREPGQLSRIQVSPSDRPIYPIGSLVPAALYRTWRDTFGPSIGGSSSAGGVREIRLADRSDTAPVRAVTPGFFALLGVHAELGRADLGVGGGHDAARPAVLAYRLWQRLFDGRTDAIGRVVWIDNDAYTVVGVMPARFWFGEMNSPLWTALDVQALSPDAALDVIVRRDAGTTPAMLEAQLRSGLIDYASRLPSGRRDFLMKVSGIEGTPMGNMMSIVLPYVLGTAVLMTLVIACANVAILMFAQWTAREHEIAIRASIGGSRGRIVRSLLTESILLAAIGGALGVCVTLALRGWVVSLGGDSAFFNFSLDRGIFAWTAAVTLLTGIAAGIAPAVYETRRLHANPLRAMAGSDRVRQRWRNALVVLEITVTVALLVVTTAMIDGYRRQTRGLMGFDTHPLLNARVENPKGVPTAQVLDIVRRIPGVASVAASSNRPYLRSGPYARVSAEATGAEPVRTETTSISAGFFSTLGVQMRAGRAFEDHESGLIAIVNETLARSLFQSRDPLGARIRIDDRLYDLVGVVADYSGHPLRYPDVEPKVFTPLPQPSAELPRLDVVIRARGDPAPLTQTVRREIRDGLTGTVVVASYTIDQILEVSGQEILVGTAPLLPLIVIGMLLTTAGIYGVLAFAVTRRSRELAVRLAVGATGADLIQLVSMQTSRLVAAGCLAGIAVTFGLSRVVRAGGGAGSIWDPGVEAFVLPVLVVVAIGALASWMPSRRALKINPSDLLRTT